MIPSLGFRRKLAYRVISIGTKKGGFPQKTTLEGVLYTRSRYGVLPVLYLENRFRLAEGLPWHRLPLPGHEAAVFLGVQLFG